jgi:isopentenyldiphosphate isomerase
MEEYLDIVDQEGNLTGEKELRSIIHEKGLWHQTVHIYFFRKKDSQIEILAHFRSKNKSSNPHKWDMRFGGHVETGQTMQEAAIRELNEETGLKINNEDLIKSLKDSYNGDKNKEIIQVYFYNFNGDIKDLTFDDGEVEVVRWISFADIQKEMEEEKDRWTGSVDVLQAIKKELQKV